MASDEELFINGGDGAMLELVGRYERPLYRFLLNLTGDRHLAEDLFQETFLRLHRARNGFETSEPLKPYLYRIALNAARDARGKRKAAPSGDAQREPEDRMSAAPAAQFEDSERRTEIRAAVEALPENEREVVTLRIFEELSFVEIARITQCPVPTAKSRMLYALRRLRPVLERHSMQRSDAGTQKRESRI